MNFGVLLDGMSRFFKEIENFVGQKSLVVGDLDQFERAAIVDLDHNRSILGQCHVGRFIAVRAMNQRNLGVDLFQPVPMRQMFANERPVDTWQFVQPGQIPSCPETPLRVD
jgi:hypothetical protein